MVIAPRLWIAQDYAVRNRLNRARLVSHPVALRGADLRQWRVHIAVREGHTLNPQMMPMLTRLAQVAGRPLSSFFARIPSDPGGRPEYRSGDERS